MRAKDGTFTLEIPVFGYLFRDPRSSFVKLCVRGGDIKIPFKKLITGEILQVNQNVTLNFGHFGQLCEIISKKMRADTHF